MSEDNYLNGFEIDMHDVKAHYMRRKKISSNLIELLENAAEQEYVELAVGITDPLANYSAYEHRLGPRILNNNSISSVFNLALRMSSKNLKITHLPKTIYDANLPYLKISVGSEIASMLQPNKFWIGNVRTIWSHLVIKHKGDWEKANEELELYRIGDVSSEMNYQIWRDIYLSMEHSLNVIESVSYVLAKQDAIKPGKLKFIWIDAVCSALYESE